MFKKKGNSSSLTRRLKCLRIVYFLNSNFFDGDVSGSGINVHDGYLRVKKSLSLLINNNNLSITSIVKKEKNTLDSMAQI